MKKNLQKPVRQMDKLQKGQVLIFAAFAIVAILAIVGLALDVGVMFIDNGRLRRAVDSAALAAALQYRKGNDIALMKSEARQFIELNGIQDPDILIVICDIDKDPYDPDNLLPDGSTICPEPGQPYRKLVYVRATATIHLAFLPVIGITEVPIAASATSEAASVDVFLLLDRSESMTFDYPSVPTPDLQMRDPSFCNNYSGSGLPGPGNDHTSDGYRGTCSPFISVKRNAVYFVNSLNLPYDRVGIITFDKAPHLDLALTNDWSTIITTIKELTVYEGDGVCGNLQASESGSPCRNYTPYGDPTGQYGNFGCEYWTATGGENSPSDTPPGPGDPSPCTSTNIGQAFEWTANQFANDPTRRDDAVWVVILLTDGGANAGYDKDGISFCPKVDWYKPYCRAADADPNPPKHHAVADAEHYDSYDFAVDEALDLIGLRDDLFVFTIGIGKEINDSVNGASSRALLYFVASKGEGLSYVAPYGGDPDKNDQELHEIFVSIAKNIATRLSR